MLTFRRPADLARVLPALAAQAAELSPPAQVIVVDNDPAGTAAQAVAEWYGSGVTYAHEPRPGIAAARNRALDEAAGVGADALVFIDDDEHPGEHWLTSIVAAWHTWQCSAVAGPVTATFDRPVDEWLVATGAFARREHRTGDVVSGAATHNLLVDLHAVADLGLRFDERLGLTGGEDTMFSHQLIARGGVIRWCDEAEVIEPVAADRLTRRWVLRRAYRSGTSWSAMKLALAGDRPRRIRCRLDLVARAVIKISLGGGLLLGGFAARDISRQARATHQIVSYAGMLMGTLGLSLREYGRPQLRKTKLLT